MDFQPVLEAIKGYGALVLTTISTAGIGGCIAVIVKIKGIIAKIKEDNKAALAKKDEVIESSKKELQLVAEQNKALISKIDTLTNDIYKLEGDVKSVKSNRTN